LSGSEITASITEQRFPDQVLVVGLAALDDGVAVVIELTGFFFHFRLATK
jgi:hypothetical protein